MNGLTARVEPADIQIVLISRVSPFRTHLEALARLLRAEPGMALADSALDTVAASLLLAESEATWCCSTSPRTAGRPRTGCTG